MKNNNLIPLYSILDQLQIEKIEKFINEPNYLFQDTLEKGKYDINYVITLLQIILKQCYDQKHHPRDLQFTLVQSIERLLDMLVTERDHYTMTK